ncbi:MAG: glycogen/starch/alpha-glucan phosphorylase, partial [Treponema sp.]|nr:glycogen/starch/alpha-glucan phosphorylase [Treponema sp.]
KVVEQLVDGTYDRTGLLFRELHDSLVYGVEGQRPDVYFILADFDSYVQAQEKVAKLYADKKGWAKKALMNIANSGKFSSDRTIEDYVKDIWHIEKMEIKGKAKN